MELPKWNDWTIDLRLKQFRKVDFDENHSPQGLKFVDFDSGDGKAIFKEYCEDQYNSFIEDAEGYQRIIFDIEDNTFDSHDAEMLAESMVEE